MNLRHGVSGIYTSNIVTPLEILRISQRRVEGLRKRLQPLLLALVARLLVVVPEVGNLLEGGLVSLLGLGGKKVMKMQQSNPW